MSVSVICIENPVKYVVTPQLRLVTTAHGCRLSQYHNMLSSKQVFQMHRSKKKKRVKCQRHMETKHPLQPAKMLSVSMLQKEVKEKRYQSWGKKGSGGSTKFMNHCTRCPIEKEFLLYCFEKVYFIQLKCHKSVLSFFQ